MCVCVFYFHVFARAVAAEHTRAPRGFFGRIPMYRYIYRGGWGTGKYDVQVTVV